MNHLTSTCAQRNSWTRVNRGIVCCASAGIEVQAGPSAEGEP
jgi:hypothetical protein